MKKSIFHIFVLLGLVSVLVFATVAPVQAAVFNNDGKIPAGQIVDDDLFLSGQSVQMDGTVNGILFADGQTVTITGTVNGDLFAFGQDIVITDKAVINGNVFSGGRSITVNGHVTGSLFSGGSDVRLGETAKVDHNLYVGGYNIATANGSTVAYDAYLGGFQTILHGDITRNLNVGASAVELYGKVGGNANLNVEAPGVNNQNRMQYMASQYQLPAAVDSGLRIDKAAVIGGKLVYTSPVQQDAGIQAAPAGGAVVWQTPVPNKNEQNQSGSNRFPVEYRFGPASILLGILRSLVTLLALGGLAVWLAPALLKRSAEQVKTRTLASLGVGILAGAVAFFGSGIAFFVIILVGVLLALVTLGGLSATVIWLGLAVLFLALVCFTLLAVYASKLVMAKMVGDWLLSKLAPQMGETPYWGLALGILIFVVLAAIPFVGGWISAAATFIGLGAIWFALRPAAKPVAPVL
jgi:cytoskeletal protein CcmA (bactofilin family)